MGLYIDSADLSDIRRAMQLGFVMGVTTNPALIAKTGRPGLDVLKDILQLTAGPVFYQVTADTLEGRTAQAHEAATLAPERLLIKLGATTENIGLCSRLTRAGIRCTVTAISAPAQAYLAGQAGAAYVAPYVHRLTTQLGDGVAVLRGCVEVLQDTPTRVIAASLKSPAEVVSAVQAGAHDITITLDLILALGEHELSHKAIADFDVAICAAHLN
jgi:transaldolase